MSDKLVSYIKKGMKQGFNEEYIKKVLLKHGYSKLEVDFAMAKATGSTKKKESKSIVVGIIAISAILVLIAFGAYVQSKARGQELQEKLMEKDQTIQGYLDQVAELSEEIDAKEKTIDQQISELQDKDLSLKEKEELVAEVQFLYQMIKQERREVRDLLVELLKEVVHRYQDPNRPRPVQGDVMVSDDLTPDRDFSNTTATG